MQGFKKYITMFVTDQDYKIVIGDQALKVVSQPGEPGQCRDGSRRGNQRLPQTQIRHQRHLQCRWYGAEQARGHVHLRHRTLSHGSIGTAEDGHGDTKGTLRTRHQVAGGSSGRENRAGSATCHRRGRKPRRLPDGVRLSEETTS